MSPEEFHTDMISRFNHRAHSFQKSWRNHEWLFISEKLYPLLLFIQFFFSGTFIFFPLFSDKKQDKRRQWICSKLKTNVYSHKKQPWTSPLRPIEGPRDRRPRARREKGCPLRAAVEITIPYWRPLRGWKSLCTLTLSYNLSPFQVICMERALLSYLEVSV